MQRIVLITLLLISYHLAKSQKFGFKTFAGVNKNFFQIVTQNPVATGMKSNQVYHFGIGGGIYFGNVHLEINYLDTQLKNQVILANKTWNFIADKYAFECKGGFRFFQKNKFYLEAISGFALYFGADRDYVESSGSYTNQLNSTTYYQLEASSGVINSESYGILSGMQIGYKISDHLDVDMGLIGYFAVTDNFLSELYYGLGSDSNIRFDRKDQMMLINKGDSIGIRLGVNYSL